jgi:hypothetical protein
VSLASGARLGPYEILSPLEQGAALLHDDRDYDAIQRIRPLKNLP